MSAETLIEGARESDLDTERVCHVRLARLGYVRVHSPFNGLRAAVRRRYHPSMANVLFEASLPELDVAHRSTGAQGLYTLSCESSFVRCTSMARER